MLLYIESLVAPPNFISHVRFRNRSSFIHILYVYWSLTGIGGFLRVINLITNSYGSIGNRLQSVSLWLSLVQLMLFPLFSRNLIVLVVLEGSVLYASVLLVHQVGLVPRLRLARGPQRVDDGGDHKDGKRHPEDHAPLSDCALEGRIYQLVMLRGTSLIIHLHLVSSDRRHRGQQCQ